MSQATVIHQVEELAVRGDNLSRRRLPDQHSGFCQRAQQRPRLRPRVHHDGHRVMRRPQSRQLPHGVARVAVVPNATGGLAAGSEEPPEPGEPEPPGDLLFVGRLRISYRYTPVPPLEDLGFRQTITDDFLANFAAAVQAA